jgi:VWFA-related protein
MRARAAVLFLLLAALCGIPLQAAPPPPPQDTEFKDEIDVRLSTIVLRVVNDHGEPIRGLGPRDFRVRIGRQEVPVVAVDWIAAGEAAPAPPPTAPALTGASAAPAPPPATSSAGSPPLPGRLVVVFVQADNNSSVRTRGHLKTLPYARKFLAALAPEDRVAVVSFDSHLKLWRDFTTDRDAAYAGIDRAIRFGATPSPVEPGEPPSLARAFDTEKALDIAAPEWGLEATATALKPLAGEKILIFLGWGLGRFGGGGTTMTPGFAPAVRALARAHTSVFVLDVTDADAHDLAAGLEAVADETGGTYAKTNELPDVAVRELLRAISGYYVLTLDPDRLPAGKRGELRIDLRKRRGTVLVRAARVR